MPSFEILWINLDSDAKRRAWMEAQLSKLDLPSRRVPGLTPSTLPDSVAKRFLPEAQEILLPGNIGCFGSHLHIAEQVAAGDMDAVVILEDDVEVRCGTDELVAIVDAAIDYDVVKLNDWPKCATVLDRRIGDYSLIRYLRVPRGTGSYILTRQGAEKVTRRARNLAISTDNWFRAEGAIAIRTAGIVPPPIKPGVFEESTLDPENRRNKARTRRYFYRPPEGTGIAPRIRFLANEFGWLTLIRLAARDAAMRIARAKRDMDGSYRIASSSSRG